jgi:hypothetical protein
MARTTAKRRGRTVPESPVDAAPPEIMTVENTKRYYPDEFIVMEVTQHSRLHGAEAGRIVFHGRSKDDAYDTWGRLAKERSGKSHFIYFADTFPSFTNLHEAVEYAYRLEGWLDD